MASPIASVKPPSFVPDDQGNNLEKEKSEKNLGFKQNRPMNLVVAHSPMFMIPPGLSPFGLLNSPGFFSPVQVIQEIAGLNLIEELHNLQALIIDLNIILLLGSLTF